MTHPAPAPLSLNSTVGLAARRHGLRAGQANSVDVLVRIQAPDTLVETAGDGAHQPPQALALVIDRSGSMSGRPLNEAWRCAEFLLGRLQPADAVALVMFDHRVQRLWPAVPLGDGAAQRAAVAGIHAGGNTNLHGGWHEGAQALCDVTGQGLKRVVLLSDGQANAGLTDTAAIAAQCADWAARGITTSSYGLGQGFNEELMIAMARAGGGNHYYGDTAEDLMEPFEQELELLGNLCLRGLQLAAMVPDGFGVEVLNRFHAVDGGWRLPDLAWGAVAWAVLRVTVPAGALPAIGEQCPLLRVAVSGQSLDGAPVLLERAGLSLPVLSPAAVDGLPDDELVTRRLVELAAADALLAMRQAAAADDWPQVDRLLEQAGRQFAGDDWVAAMLEAMRQLASSRERERAMKEMLYSSGKLRSRLAEKDEGVAFSVEANRSAPAYLRRKPAQGKGDL